MESLDDIIIKRDSWTSMLELLKPYIAPQNWHMIGPAKEQWNAIPKGDKWNVGTGSYVVYCTDGEIIK